MSNLLFISFDNIKEMLLERKSIKNTGCNGCVFNKALRRIRCTETVLESTSFVKLDSTFTVLKKR